MSGPGRSGPCSWRGWRSSSTGGMTAPASACWTATASTPCGRSATCRRCAARSPPGNRPRPPPSPRRRLPWPSGRCRRPASATPAFLRDTRHVKYIGDDELVVLRSDSTEFYTPAGEPVEHEVVEIDWDADTAEKQGYETFMLKEINEQADAVAETIGERAARGASIDLGDLGAIDDDVLRSLRRIVIVACGTSYHAGLLGRYAIEEWSRVPVEVEVASEYRYRNPVLDSDVLVVGVSQSGETTDTLAAMRTARDRGAKVLAVTNIM